MSDYKITVVVPTYNTGKFLDSFLDSIKSQTLGFEDIEVIFVDDDSTDSYTLELLEKLDDSYENVNSIFLSENSGYPGRGRNIGLDNAKGEFIIFADHDDSYESNAFEVMYDKITEENADFLVSNYYKVYPHKKEKVRTIFGGENVVVNSFNEDLRLFKLDPAIWTKLFMRNFLVENNIRFLEGMLAEDMELYVHSLLKANKIVYLDDFYSYNYSIRDTDKDKSTIHLRNKEILSKMVLGYFEIDNLLKSLDYEEYFGNIFEKHIIYWITSLIDSDISSEDKKELLQLNNELIQKSMQTINEKDYSNLLKLLEEENYEKALKNISKLKKKRYLINKIKNLIFHR